MKNFIVLAFIWSVFLMVILVLDATTIGFHLPDKVIIALIFGVTVNIIVLMALTINNELEMK